MKIERARSSKIRNLKSFKKRRFYNFINIEKNVYLISIKIKNKKIYYINNYINFY